MTQLRGSGDVPPGSPMAPSPRTSFVASELFHRTVTAKGCRIHDDPLDCEYPIQAAHIISRQSLRRHGHGDKVWDVRNGLGACYKAHRRSDAALQRFPAELLDDDFWAFAGEVGLSWLAERIYGERKVAA